MIAVLYLRFAVVFGVVGIAMGILMAASHDHSLAPAHAHVNLVGWVSLFLFGLFYRVYPHRAGVLAWAQLVLSVLGMVLLGPGVVGVIQGAPWGEPMAVSGSFLTLAAFLIFAYVVFRTKLTEPH